jgi:hypothetical protein
VFLISVVTSSLCVQWEVAYFLDLHGAQDRGTRLRLRTIRLCVSTAGPLSEVCAAGDAGIKSPIGAVGTDTCGEKVLFMLDVPRCGCSKVMSCA